MATETNGPMTLESANVVTFGNGIDNGTLDFIFKSEGSRLSNGSISWDVVYDIPSDEAAGLNFSGSQKISKLPQATLFTLPAPNAVSKLYRGYMILEIQGNYDMASIKTGLEGAGGDVVWSVNGSGHTVATVEWSVLAPE